MAIDVWDYRNEHQYTVTYTYAAILNGRKRDPDPAGGTNGDRMHGIDRRPTRKEAAYKRQDYNPS